MTSREMDWQEAIITVLQDAGEPLHYQRITELIGERGLRKLSGATPANSVVGYLSRMTTEGNLIYDERIQRVARGVYVFADPTNPAPEPQQDEDVADTEEFDTIDEGQSATASQIVSVPAFGLYWEKAKVNWGRGSSGILGRQAAGSEEIDFSEQHGVYLLHKDRSVVYVGRTTDSLRKRLDWHNRDVKAPRWNQFSWFGFRGVDDTGQLNPLPGEIDTGHFVAILESVLIEALEPPVNGRRGDYMGVLYEQVSDPMIQAQEDAKLRSMMADSLNRR